MSCHQEPTANGYPSKISLLKSQTSNGTSREAQIFTTEVSIELQQSPKEFQLEKLNGDFYLNITEPKGHTPVDNEENKFINNDNLIHINTTEENTNDHCEDESDEETFNSCMTTFSETLQEPQSTYQNLLSIDDEEQVSERVRRCSSLKTGKTPPGTPKRKKIVRFADVFGLDLTDVKIFLDEIPRIPISAFNDLSASQAILEPEVCSNAKSLLPILLPMFQQPGAQLDFIERVRNDKVCLDSALAIDDPEKFTLKGVVRVRNLDFHKNVQIRYTTDSWQHFTEVEACYVQNSCDGFSDKFSFMIYTNRLEMWQKFEFAIRYRCGCGEFWDNNKGKNYSFQFVPSDFKDTTKQDDNIVFY